MDRHLRKALRAVMKEPSVEDSLNIAPADHTHESAPAGEHNHDADYSDIAHTHTHSHNYAEILHTHNPLDAWPIGSIFITVSATAPATLLGGGTWVAFGTGRVLVGIDAAQTEFDTIEETGGAKTHTLQLTEIPSHSHIMPVGATDDTAAPFDRADAGTNASGANATTASGTAGGGLAHNNLQPYIVVRMYKRTA